MGEIDDYLEWLGSRHLDNEGKEVSEHYLKVTAYTLRRAAKEFQLDSFKDLTKDEVKTWVRGLHQGLTEASVRAYGATLRAFLRWLNDGETPECLKGLSFTGAIFRVKSYDDLVSDEVFSKTLARLPLHYRTALRMIRYSGCRPGEVIGLRHKDARILTREGREFLVMSVEKDKNGVSRSPVVPDAETIAVFKEYMAYAPDSEWMFPAPRRDGPVSYQTLWRAVDRACRGAKVDHWHPYRLRHTWLSKEGAKLPENVRLENSGTSSLMVINHYQRLGAEGTIDAMLELGGGKPVVGDKATETLKEVRDKLEALANRDAALAEALRDILGSMPAFKMVDRAGRTVSGTDRDPLVGVARKLERLIDGLEGVGD